jgi:hypothetical protein
VITTPFQDYQRTIIERWRQLSCTSGSPPQGDRAFLLDLYHRKIPLPLVLVALQLADARRSPEIPPVRSIAYFRSVIDELTHADPNYVAYLQQHLSR